MTDRLRRAQEVLRDLADLPVQDREAALARSGPTTDAPTLAMATLPTASPCGSRRPQRANPHPARLPGPCVRRGSS